MGEKIKVHSDVRFNADQVPGEFDIVDNAARADLIISNTLLKSGALLLRPKNLIAGIGCNRGTQKQEIQETVEEVLQREGLSFYSIKSLATIDVKENEKGLLEFAQENDLALEFYSKDKLNMTAQQYGMKESEAVREATGAVAVAEPAAMLSANKISGDSSLILNKQKRGNVTLAIAKAKFTL